MKVRVGRYAASELEIRREFLEQDLALGCLAAWVGDPDLGSSEDAYRALLYAWDGSSIVAHDRAHAARLAREACSLSNGLDSDVEEGALPPEEIRVARLASRSLATAFGKLLRYAEGE